MAEHDAERACFTVRVPPRHCDAQAMLHASRVVSATVVYVVMYDGEVAPLPDWLRALTNRA